MGLGTEADATIVAREAPHAFLIEFAFASGTERVWTGFGKLVTSDARQWSGVGKLARIDGLSAGLGTAAPAGRIMASGVSTEALAAAVDATEYKDRVLNIYLQPFTGRAIYGAPVPLATRIMKSLEISRNGETRTIAVNHEGPYTGRRRPPAGWYSYHDQQKRSPGDLFCERVFDLLFKQERFPDY